MNYPDPFEYESLYKEELESGNLSSDAVEDLKELLEEYKSDIIKDTARHVATFYYFMIHAKNHTKAFTYIASIEFKTYGEVVSMAWEREDHSKIYLTEEFFKKQFDRAYCYIKDVEEANVVEEEYNTEEYSLAISHDKFDKRCRKFIKTYIGHVI